MGAGLLRTGAGTRVRRLEARLLLPGASVLHERRGTEPGESFSISKQSPAHILVFAHRLRFITARKESQKNAFVFYLIIIFYIHKYQILDKIRNSDADFKITCTSNRI